MVSSVELMMRWDDLMSERHVQLCVFVM